MNNENIDNLNKLIIINDKNKDGFISLKEFISSEKSLGPREIPKGLFKHYAQGTLSYHFINLLIKTNHPIISKIVCLPNLNYCIYSKLGTNFKNMELDFPTQINCKNILNKRLLYSVPIKSNLLLFNPPEYTKDYKKNIGYNAYNFVIPDTLLDNLYYCKSKHKTMVFLNLTFITTINGNVAYQHANILIINLILKTIERFDPHGGSTFIDINSSDKVKRIKNLKKVYKQELIDEILRSKFKTILPDFKYLDLNDTCPYLGPQAKVDKFGGLCITWSLMYFLLRVLNPFLDQSQINKQMISGNHKQILNKVLQFQRYVIDYLRNA